MTDITDEKILTEKAKIEKDIEDLKKEIIGVSRYRKAAEALLAALETAYNEYYAATRALTDDEWKKNFG